MDRYEDDSAFIDLGVASDETKGGTEQVLDVSGSLQKQIGIADD